MSKSKEQLEIENAQLKQRVSELEGQLNNFKGEADSDGLEKYHARSGEMRFENADEIYELGHS